MSEETLSNIPGMKPEETVVIRVLGFGSVSKLRSVSTSITADPLTKKTSIAVDVGEYNKTLLALGVKSAPFFPGLCDFKKRISIIESDGITSEAGEHIVKELRRLNKLEEVEDLKKE